MREIKFRAWDGKKMRYMPVMLIGVGQIGFTDEFYVDITDSYPQEKAEVMQFTGLADKNGVEIYEGDIVRCTSGCPHEVKWFNDNGGTFVGGMPGFNLDGLYRNGGSGYAWDGSEEVIGNIYQNPELLK